MKSFFLEPYSSNRPRGADFGTNRMDLKVTSPSAVKWMWASGSSLSCWRATRWSQSIQLQVVPRAMQFVFHGSANQPIVMSQRAQTLLTGLCRHPRDCRFDFLCAMSQHTRKVKPSTVTGGCKQRAKCEEVQRSFCFFFCLNNNVRLFQ